MGALPKPCQAGIQDLGSKHVAALGSRSMYSATTRPEHLRVPSRLSRLLPRRPVPRFLLPICFLLQVIDDQGHVLPPGVEGDLGIRIKPNRPIGIFSGYVVMNAGSSPLSLVGIRGSERNEGRVPELRVTDFPRGIDKE